MTNFKLAIDYIFNMLSKLFNTCTSHWLLGLFLLIGIFSLIINLILVVKGTNK